VSNFKEWIKILVIVFMIVAVIGLHYLTAPQMRYEHAIYRMLFYLPLVLGSFWFGLKGALYISGSVASLYLLHLADQWKGFSYGVFEKLLEMILYLVIALVIGLLVERERTKHRALLRAESLAAIGRTVSEVAHDIKTPLIAIGGLVSQFSRNLPTDDPGRKKLHLVIQEAARLESMVNEMLEFGRPMELHPTKFNLNEIVHQSIEITQEMARKAGVEIKSDLDASLPLLMLDAPRLKQVLLNLITNAVQASPAGERVLVRTHLIRKRVEIEVSDRGSGIKEADQNIVFSPFFSTKRGGTGLGLAIVKKIVEAHGGNVSFHSNPEMGVTFVVQLPLRQD
jgi:two-component system sensor histidine kinase HydH